MNNRPLYINQLIRFLNKKAIKVITGVRRCGKSHLLLLFIEYLKSNDIKPENIIYVNFESLEYEDYTYKMLYNLVKGKILNNDKYYLFFDEVERVQGWEKAVNSFIVDFDVDVYITGSNAYLLSSELATYLSGRFVEIKMLPLSFKEFIDFNSIDSDIDEAFELYLKYGGFPSLSDYSFADQEINQVLESIYNAVVVKDVISRSNIKDNTLLRKIILFLADNVGSIVSPNKIANIIKNEDKDKVASRTVENYINLLTSAYIFYNIERYDIKGKEYLKTLGKYYIVDIGLRNNLLGYRDLDRGHILENIVYLELLRRNYKVAIGKIYNNEVDFIATNSDKKVYFQISETILGEETRNRELKPLLSINDNYEKVILTMDKNFIAGDNGIIVKNIIHFLLEDF